MNGQPDNKYTNKFNKFSIRYTLYDDYDIMLRNKF